MPIVFNDDNTTSQVNAVGQQTAFDAKLYSPKFFNSSILTGKGGQSKGLLNEKRDPKMFINGYPVKVNPNLMPGSHYNKDVHIYDIPCYIISPGLWKHIEKMDRPDAGDMTLIATKGDEKIYLTMPIHAMQLEEQSQPDPNGSAKNIIHRDLSVCMHMFLFDIKDDNIKEHKQINYSKSFITNTKENLFKRTIIHNIFIALRNVEATLTKEGYIVNKDAMNDFVQDYSLYTELCKAAEKWIDNTDYYIADVLIKNIAAQSNNIDDDLWTGNIDSVFETLSYIEKFNISLPQYQNIYNKIKQTVAPEILNRICKANLNLRMSNTLQQMNANKQNLQFCPCNVHVTPKIPYSQEQQKAIESISPLTLVQSGAGTGKSTVILGRIDHMIANGIDPNDITVLSFTNAAADHITDLKPTIHSMTIATMLHKIYSQNFPTHQLSSLATIINSLDIYFDPLLTNITNDKEKFISEFKYVLMRLQNHNEYTKANNFVDDHLDEVIDALNTIGQTSLELEGIICYQKMDTLNEPDDIKTKHLIIDEVQDNSIAEFIYSITYTNKHLCSMYIVGDCSQTLYEFRSSNPKALNVLEGSGVFDTYKLQTNYRSNQEILDFANVLLGNIEANQYANIQLKANSLKPVTEQSFKEAVHLKYERMSKKSSNDYENMLAHSLVIMRDYIQEKLDKKEQICILAPARHTLWSIKSYLEKMYPGKDRIVSIIPDRQYDNDLFTKFIAKYWNTISYTPPVNILTTIEASMLQNIHSLTYMKGSSTQTVYDKIDKLINDFKNQYGATVENWQNQVMMSVLSQQEMLNSLKKLLITFEIKRNNIAQKVTSAKNTSNRTSDDISHADFIISTIHSAKGLEFDNVIIYYASESENTIDEATKRMYYVALTRAKKSEFIFAYDTLAHPKVKGDYEKIIKDLADKDANVIPANDMIDDAVSDNNTPTQINNSLFTKCNAETPIIPIIS